MNKKKILSLLLVGTTVLSTAGLFSCGRSNEPVKSRRTNVYSGTELSMPEDIQWISEMAATEDQVYLIYTKQVEVTHYADGSTEVGDAGMEPGMNAKEVAAAVAVVEEVAVEETAAEGVTEEMDDGSYVTYENRTCVYVTNMDGSQTGTYELDIEAAGNGYMNSMTFGDGMMYMMYETWGESQGFVLYKVDPTNGSVMGTYDMNMIREAAGLTEEDYFYINNMAVNGDTLCLNLENKILLYDLPSGKVGKTYEVDTVNYINRLYMVDGVMYYSGYEDGRGQAMFTLDPATGQSAKVEMNSGDANGQTSITNYYNMIGSDGGKMYFRDQEGVMEWDPTTSTAKEVMNFINCDISPNNINDIFRVPGDRFVYYSSEWTENKTEFTLTILNRIPDEQMQEEIILTVASVYQNYQLTNTIIDFNRQNTGVRLNIKTYDEYNNEENEWRGGVTQLNADITMGKVPDILVLDSQLPVESYYSKGVFTDLYAYMDGEENGVDRNTLLTNVLEACERDGKLYSLIISFTLMTLAGLPEFVGTEPGWTLAEMLDVVENVPEGMNVYYDYGREALKTSMFQYCGDLFVDWETGTTSFDSPEFIRFIEFLKNCPEKSVMQEYYDNIDYDNYDGQAEQEFYNNYEMRFYNKEALFSEQYVSGFNAYNTIYRTFGGDATLIGFPTNVEGDSGAIISPNLELGICAASPNRDSAWVFLKYLLTSGEYLEDTWGFVLLKAENERKLANSEEEYKDWFYEYTDEDWERMESQYSAEYLQYMKNSQIRYTMDQGEMVNKLLTTTNKVARNDTSLMEIIDEELSTFFGGAKSAAETADIINSRARIYISENS